VGTRAVRYRGNSDGLRVPMRGREMCGGGDRSAWFAIVCDCVYIRIINTKRHNSTVMSVARGCVGVGAVRYRGSSDGLRIPIRGVWGGQSRSVLDLCSVSVSLVYATKGALQI